MLCWSFQAPPPYRAYGRWWFVIEGRERRCHGPFRSEPAALAAREQLFARWVARAAAVDGEALRIADAVWLVRLPPDHPCAGLPFRGQAVAVASPEPSSGGAPSQPSATGAPSQPSATGAPSQPSATGAPSGEPVATSD